MAFLSHCKRFGYWDPGPRFRSWFLATYTYEDKFLSRCKVPSSGFCKNTSPKNISFCSCSGSSTHHCGWRPLFSHTNSGRFRLPPSNSFAISSSWLPLSHRMDEVLSCKLALHGHCEQSYWCSGRYWRCILWQNHKCLRLSQTNTQRVSDNTSNQPHDSLFLFKKWNL